MATFSVIKFGKGPRSEGAVIERKGWFSTTRWVKVLDQDHECLDKWVNSGKGSYHYAEPVFWEGDAFYRAQEAANG